MMQGQHIELFNERFPDFLLGNVPGANLNLRLHCLETTFALVSSETTIHLLQWRSVQKETESSTEILIADQKEEMQNVTEYDGYIRVK